MSRTDEFNSESLYNSGRAAEMKLIQRMAKYKGWMRSEITRKYLDAIEKLTS